MSGITKQEVADQIRSMATTMASTGVGVDVGAVDWVVLIALLQDLLSGFCFKGKSPEAQQQTMRRFHRTVKATLTRQVRETQEVNSATSVVLADVVYQYGVNPANVAGLRSLVEGE